MKPCIFPGCVSSWEHYHGGFPGGYENPDDADGPPIPFTGPDPDPGAVRDYNGAALPTGEEPTMTDRLREALAEALCATFDLGHNHDAIDSTMGKSFHAVQAISDADAILAHPAVEAALRPLLDVVLRETLVDVDMHLTALRTSTHELNQHSAPRGRCKTGICGLLNEQIHAIEAALDRHLQGGDDD